MKSYIGVVVLAKKFPSFLGEGSFPNGKSNGR
jgi:hypothetical protein